MLESSSLIIWTGKATSGGNKNIVHLIDKGIDARLPQSNKASMITETTAFFDKKNMQ